MRLLWNFVLNIVGISIGLWAVVTWVPGIELDATPDRHLITFLLLTIVFIFINTVIAPIIRLLGMPLTCLTLGLFSLVINGLVLMIAGWVFNSLEFHNARFIINGLWPAIIGAVVLSIISGIVNFFTSPLRARR